MRRLSKVSLAATALAKQVEYDRACVALQKYERAYARVLAKCEADRDRDICSYPAAAALVKVATKYFAGLDKRHRACSIAMAKLERAKKNLMLCLRCGRDLE
jgi:hypothetical protein